MAYFTTKKGDNGNTSFGSEKVNKSCKEIFLVANLDMLKSQNLKLAHMLKATFTMSDYCESIIFSNGYNTRRLIFEFLQTIDSTLFNIMALFYKPTEQCDFVKNVDEFMEKICAQIPQISYFVVPVGLLAIEANICRTQTRLTESIANNVEPINYIFPYGDLKLLAFLNRLSDAYFAIMLLLEVKKQVTN
jgi:cob(I)alamin adenosyltransferase